MPVKYNLPLDCSAPLPHMCDAHHQGAGLGSLADLLIVLRDVSVGAAPSSYASSALSLCPKALDVERALRTLELVPAPPAPGLDTLLDRSDCELPRPVRTRICANAALLRSELCWADKDAAIAVMRAVELWLLQRLAPAPFLSNDSNTSDSESHLDLISEAMSLTGVDDACVDAIGKQSQFLANAEYTQGLPLARTIGGPKLCNDPAQSLELQQEDKQQYLQSLVRTARRMTDILVDDPGHPQARSLAALVALCPLRAVSVDSKAALWQTWFVALRALHQPPKPLLDARRANDVVNVQGSERTTVESLGMALIAPFLFENPVALGLHAPKALAVLAQMESSHAEYAALQIGLHPGPEVGATPQGALDFVAAALSLESPICLQILQNVSKTAGSAT
jgi:hypothetical protein